MYTFAPYWTWLNTHCPSYVSLTAEICCSVAGFNLPKYCFITAISCKWWDNSSLILLSQEGITYPCHHLQVVSRLRCEKLLLLTADSDVLSDELLCCKYAINAIFLIFYIKIKYWIFTAYEILWIHFPLQRHISTIVILSTHFIFSCTNNKVFSFLLYIQFLLPYRLCFL